MNLENLEVHLTNAISDERLGNFKSAEQEALLILNEIALLPPSEQTHQSCLLKANATSLLGTLHWRAGNLEGALLSYTASLSDFIHLNDRAGVARVTGNIGLVHSHMSDFDKALQHYQEAMSIDEELNNANGVAGWLINMGGLYTSLSEYSLAMECFRKALAISERDGSVNEISLTLGNMGIVYKEMSDFANAIEHHQRAFALALEAQNKNGMFIHLTNIALTYQVQSDFARSLEFLNRALSTAEEIGNKLGMATIYGNIGLVYMDMFDFALALENLSKALTLDEEIGNKAGVSRHLSNMGLVYSNLSDIPRSLEYLTRALSLSEEIGDKNSVGQLLGNIGGVYLALSNDHEAMQYFIKALAIAEEFGDKKGVAIWNGSLGEVNLKLHNREKALSYLEQSLRLNEDLGQTVETANIKSSLGSYFADAQYPSFDAPLAEKYLLESITLHERLGVKNYNTHQALSQLYELQANAVDALHHYKQYFRIEREVQSEETKKQSQRFAYERQIGELRREQDVTERILHNILPKEIASRIRRGDKNIIEKFDSVSVLFADIVGFTKLSQRVTPEELVAVLDSVFNSFDILADKHGCEKIKTIGDCYMVVAGLPERMENHAVHLGRMAVDMLNAIENIPAISDVTTISMRIGIHSGSVVAGIIGKNKYSYDLWGDAVNIASRMESHGEVDKIHVSEAFRNLAAGEFTFSERGEMEVKGKGMMRTYFLERR